MNTRYTNTIILLTAIFLHTPIHTADSTPLNNDSHAKTILEQLLLNNGELPVSLQNTEATSSSETSSSKAIPLTPATAQKLEAIAIVHSMHNSSVHYAHMKHNLSGPTTSLREERRQTSITKANTPLLPSIHDSRVVTPPTQESSLKFIE